MENTQSQQNAKQAKFMELYNPLHERLNRFVHSMVWNRDDAKDVLSETVLAAYESFEKVRDHQSFLYYLFGIASRLAKKRDRRKKFWGIFEPSKVELIISHHNSESRIVINELYAALNKLPIKQREAISLFEISGFSIKEIAEMQDSTLSGVKSRLMRARETLSELLEVEKPRKAINEISMNPIAISSKKTTL